MLKKITKFSKNTRRIKGMTTTIKAKFINGMFQPLENLELLEDR